ncbi:MATN2 [Branchiostoma lanceolatum]|uniref:MATN2 protein n=1 Tax=Branchiostoma lanceolatum TaxID=7740 RepID=A0A8J9VQA7_BRALA|nr:MATN2 [Branchiostoma lanceolatum]
MAGCLVLMFVGMVVAAAPFVAGTSLSARGAHVCSRRTAYQQPYTVTETESRRQSYTRSCGWWSRCRKYRPDGVQYPVQGQGAHGVPGGLPVLHRLAAVRKLLPNTGLLQFVSEWRGLHCPKRLHLYQWFQGKPLSDRLVIFSYIRLSYKNECSSNNGGCSQTCSNTRGSYVCSCRQGFVLDSDGRGCSDHDECAASDHGCQQQCLNSHGGYSCGCEDGYELDRNGKTCSDVDECASSPCSQTCTQNAPGHGYQCSCADGYILEDDGTSCEPQCPQGCGNGGRCASPGVCECVRGFSGNACQEPVCDPPCENGGVCDAPDVCFCQPGFDGEQCQNDLDECAINNGGCAHNCTNQRGSYRCECREGYVLDGNNKGCSDHDECAADDHGCDFCQNMEGSYRCYCGVGYVLDDDGKKCRDINECAGDNDCEEICMNTNGSYACACLPGFYLDGNGINCLDHDECATHDHGCQHQCVNSRGFYSCECHDGFLLQDDLRSCVDIDECAAEESPCGQICENSEGGYQCLCEDGYALIPEEPGQCEHIKARLAQSGDHWTKNSTGCQCYFDYSRFDCACCVDGGCQCIQDVSYQCVQCGLYSYYLRPSAAGIDGWTLSESGCQCPGGNRLNLSCPCCQNRGCPCTNNVPGRCAQCGRETHCEEEGDK